MKIAVFFITKYKQSPMINPTKIAMTSPMPMFISQSPFRISPKTKE